VLETWEAESLERVLEEGRTKPLVLSCARATGPATRNGRFVVKAVGLPEITERHLAYEVIGNLIARELAVKTAKPAIVRISQDAADALNVSLADHGIELKAGLGAGAEYLTGLVGAMPLAKPPPSQVVQCARLYAFDLLVQNPDRRPDNPNYAEHQGSLVAYDFEMCFSFVQAILQQGEPWEVSTHGIAQGHVLHSKVRGQQIDWSAFGGRLENLMSSKRFEKLVASLPSAWRPYADPLRSHLEEVVAHREEFELELRRSLS